MAATTFDTHKAVKTLTSAEITEPQAEALVAVLDEITINLVTKDDLRRELSAHKSGLNGQMADLDNRLTGQMAELDNKLTGQMAELRSEFTGQMAELDGRLTGQMAELRSEFTGQMNDLDARLTGQVRDLDARQTRQMNDLDKKMTAHLAALKLEIAEFKASIFKQLWIMTGSLAGVVVLATLSLIIAILRLYFQ